MTRVLEDGIRRPRRVVVTGGSGFIGTNAVQYHVDCGDVVLNLDRSPPRQPMHNQYWTRCDILDSRQLQTALGSFAPDYVLHLAARTDLREHKSIDAYAANFEGVRNILDAASATPGVRRVIVASSRMVCRIGHRPTREDEYSPPNLYGESKVRAERLVRAARTPFEWIIVRPTSIWGPWFDVPYRDFFEVLLSGYYVHPGRADPRKSFGFVGNTVYQLDRLLKAPASLVHRKTIYLCDYPPLRLREWADHIRRALDRPPIRSLPITALWTVARLGDVLAALGWYRVPLTTFRLRNLLTDMTYDTELLQLACGELPYTLEQGVRATLAWMRFVNGSKTT